MSHLNDHLKFRTQPGLSKTELLRAESVNLLYSQARVSMIAHAVLIPLMIFIYSRGVPIAWVLLWACALALAVAGRLGVVIHYFRAPIYSESLPEWERRFTFSLFWVGLFWGLSGALFTPYLDQMGQIVAILVIIGLSGSGMSAFSHHRPSHIAFSWPLVSPLALYWFFTATGEGAVIGASLVLYLLLTTRTVVGFQNGLHDVMSISYDRMASIGELTHLTRQLAAANQALNEREGYLKAVLDAMSDGLCVVDLQGKIIGVTPSLCTMYGYTEAELVGQDVAMLIGGQHWGQHDGHLREHAAHPMKKLVNRSMQGEGLRRDGSRFPIEVSVTETSTGGSPLYVSLIRDVTERQAMIATLEQTLADLRQQKEKVQVANEELAFLSTHDPLTGLPNRRYFDDFSGRMWRQAQRRHEWLAILLIDIDQFKQYNDHYGHLAGDACLVRVAEALAQQINRAGDLAARYGGEEFIVFLGNTEIEGAQHIAEAVRHRVQELAIPHPTSSHRVVTISIGVAACSPVKGSRIEQLISRADTAMYAAKLAGRNRVEMDALHGVSGCQEE